MAQYRYVPMLRSKAGEASALHQLSTHAKHRMQPVLHIPANPPASFGDKIAAAWAGHPIALDGLYNVNATGSGSAFTTLFKKMGAGGLPVIPSIEADSPATYLSMVSGAIGAYAPGLVVKAKINQIPSLASWVLSQGWTPSDVDLVVDGGPVSDYGASVVAGNLIPLFQQHLVSAGWRSISLAAAAAPKDMGSLGTGRTLVPREDWKLWNMVASQLAPFVLNYGDYAISHPDLTDPPGYAMAKATVSVRYAVDDEWIIIKGAPQSGPRGVPMGTQYRSHASALTAEPKFGGLSFCWADDRIQQIASGSVNSGNRTTWVTIGLNRHLSLVADRLP